MVSKQQNKQRHKINTTTMTDEILSRPIEVIAFDASVPKRKQDHIMILIRMKRNLEETGHPMHHKVEDGIIVDLDVTLEHWINQLNPLPCVPVNRTYYGFDLYAGKEGE